MKRILLSSVILASLSLPTTAQFVDRSTPWTNPGMVALTCVPPLDRTERNPVVRIHVTLTFHDGPASYVQSFHVSHEFLDTNYVVRSDQYRDARLWKIPHKTEWAWTGTNIPRPTITMVGRVWRDIHENWYYEEATSRNGAVTWRSTARCRETDHRH